MMLKKFTVILSLISILFSICISCSSEAELLKNSPNPQFDLAEYEKMLERHEHKRLMMEDRKKQMMILSEYLKLDKDEYTLEISENEAFDLGVSTENYNRAKKEIENTNNIIKKTRSAGGKIKLFDVQRRAIEYKRDIKSKINSDTITINKSTSQDTNQSTPRSISHGSIITTSSSPQQDTFVAYGKKVRFRCGSSAALIPIYHCSVEINGSSVGETAIGSLFCRTNIYIDIPGALHGDVGILTFATTDSNGGSCYWEVQ